MLLFAVKEGIVSSVNKKIRDYGWALNTKDQPMSSTTGEHDEWVCRGEAPGTAWAYNDYAITLYVKTLFDLAYGTTPDTAPGMQIAWAFSSSKTARSSLRAAATVCTPRRVISHGIAWLWLNKGNWNGTQLLPTQYFDNYMKPHVPINLPRTTISGTDYLGIGTIGGGSDQTRTVRASTGLTGGSKAMVQRTRRR